MEIVPRSKTSLPLHPDSYYPGPYAKRGICWHHMGAHESYPVTEARALQIQKVNHDYQIHKWGSIDIIEGYDLVLVGSGAWALEGRPCWSNCDAFSGAAKIGYPYIGVEVSGNYDVNQPRDEMLQAMAELACELYLGGKCGMDFSHGHRDFNYLSSMGGSNCPGNNLYARLADVQAEAERLIKGGGEEEDMIYAGIKQPKEDGLFVLEFPDLFVSLADERYRAFLAVKAGVAPLTNVYVYGTPAFPAGVGRKLGKWERVSFNAQDLWGGKAPAGGLGLTVKSDVEVAATVTILKG